MDWTAERGGRRRKSKSLTLQKQGAGWADACGYRDKDGTLWSGGTFGCGASRGWNCTWSSTSARNTEELGHRHDQRRSWSCLGVFCTRWRTGGRKIPGHISVTNRVCQKTFRQTCTRLERSSMAGICSRSAELSRVEGFVGLAKATA